MAEGQGRQRWAHTAMLCALIANAHRDPKKGRAYKPSDFDPTSRTSESVTRVTPENIGQFKQAFLQNEGRKGI